MNNRSSAETHPLPSNVHSALCRRSNLWQGCYAVNTDASQDLYTLTSRVPHFSASVVQVILRLKEQGLWSILLCLYKGSAHLKQRSPSTLLLPSCSKKALHFTCMPLSGSSFSAVVYCFENQEIYQTHLDIFALSKILT